MMAYQNENFRAEMESELNARDDYWAEIAFEMQDFGLEDEMAYRAEEAAIDEQDAMEARGGPDWRFIDCNEIPY